MDEAIEFGLDFGDPSEMYVEKLDGRNLLFLEQGRDFLDSSVVKGRHGPGIEVKGREKSRQALANVAGG